MTVEPAPISDSVPVAEEPVPRRRAASASWLSPASPALVYVGLALVAAGFGVIAFTWSRVAGTAIVALQLPYVASGGFAGLGLLIVGVLCVHLAAKRRDAWQRERRLIELAAALEALAARIDHPKPVEDPGPYGSA